MNVSSSADRRKKTYQCPAGCSWSRTNWGDLLKHLAMSADELHAGWRVGHGLPAKPVALGEKGRQGYIRDVKIVLFSVLWGKKK